MNGQKIFLNLIKTHKNCNEEYFFEFYVQYPQTLHELRNDLPFLPDRIKTEKVGDLFTNLYDKTESIIHIRNLKQELNHGLILIKINKVIKSLAKVVF